MCQTMARVGGVTRPRRSRTPGNRGIRRQRLPPGGSLPRSPWASTHRHVRATGQRHVRTLRAFGVAGIVGFVT